MASAIPALPRHPRPTRRALESERLESECEELVTAINQMTAVQLDKLSLLETLQRRPPTPATECAIAKLRADVDALDEDVAKAERRLRWLSAGA